MSKVKPLHTDARRDGSSLLSLATWVDELDIDLNDLTRRIQLSKQNEASDYHSARIKALGESLDHVSVTISELLRHLPSANDHRGTTESRLLCMGLIAQWLDHESRARRSAQAGIHGNTESFPLTSVMQFIAGQEKTGLLKVLAAEETFYLEFAEGDLVHAASDNAPHGERLGDILVEKGMLTPVRLQALVGIASRQRNRLGLELLDRKLITEEQLVQALETQVRRILQRILAQDATFEFREDASRHQPKKVRLPTVPLLLELATELDQSRHEVAGRGPRR